MVRRRKTVGIAKRVSRLAKQTTKRFKKLRRQVVRKSKSAKRKVKRGIRISRKKFRKLSKTYQLRGKALTARRAEQRQEIKGTFDLSNSKVVQAAEGLGGSRPGEPPKKRTGQGWYSIKAELRLRGKQIVSRTYVDKKIAPYMAMWEFRTDGQQRPFLKPGLMNNLPKFQTRVGAELKRAATTAAKKKAVVK